jgi:hypothetical protein
MKYFPVPQDKVEPFSKDSLLPTSTSLLGGCAFLARAVEEEGREERPPNLYVFDFCHCITSVNSNSYTLPYV